MIARDSQPPACPAVIPFRAPGRSGGGNQESIMITLGIILLVIGFVTGISILWTIGIILVVLGAIFFLLGAMGHAVAGRKHYW